VTNVYFRLPESLTIDAYKQHVMSNKVTTNITSNHDRYRELH